MQKRWISGLLIGMMVVLALAGCSKKQKASDSTISANGNNAEIQTQQGTESEMEFESEADTEAGVAGIEGLDENGELLDGYVYSYLTGLPVVEELGNLRPIAVMMNNAAAGQPQSGICDAQVVYEAPAEGGINRLMPLFYYHNDTERIGSVRSARTNFVYYAAEFQSIFVHYGQAKFAELHLQTIFCDNLNALENTGDGVFFRTTDRKSPHNAYTDMEKIHTGMTNANYWPYYHDYSGTHPYGGTYQFNHDPEGVTPENGMDALKVVPGYPINEPWFEYDEASGQYLRYQYGAAHVDDKGEQVAVKNILIVSQPCEHYYDTPYLNFDVMAGGTGYFVTNGKAIPVTWEKDEEWGITHYYDASGNEIELNPGKTWVCVVQQALEGNIKISGSLE